MLITRSYLKNDFSLSVSLPYHSAVLCVQRFFNAENHRVEDAENRRVFNQSKAIFETACNSRARPILLLLCLVAAGVGLGCRQDMQDQPRYEVYEQSPFFADGRASRNLPDGVVPRGYLRDDDHLYLGKITGGAQRGGAVQTSQTAGQNIVGGSAETNTAVASPGSPSTQSDPNNVDTFPFPVTAEVLNRGQERYQIFCSVCHGLTGYGDGMVVRRGYKKPTSYHDERLRGERIGHFYDVITNGWGTMPKYAAQITPRDRWAIAAYIRTLQLSQGARLEDVPEAERRQLEENHGPISPGGQPAHGEESGARGEGNR